MPVAKMYLLNCITHKNYARKLLARLSSIEAIELCDIRKTPLYKKGYLLSMTVNEKEEEEVASIKSRLLRIFENLDAQPPPIKETPQSVEGDILSPEELKKLTEIEKEAERFGTTRDVLLRSRERIKTYLSKVQNLLGIDIRIEDLRSLKYLYYSFGVVPQAQMPRLVRSLENVPHVIVPVREEHLFIFGLKKDKDKIEEILKSVFFERLELPTRYRGEPENAAKLIELEIKRLDLALENLKIRVKRFFFEREAFLKELWQRVMWRDLSIRVRKFCGRTNYFIALSGWVPESKRKIVEQAIDEACEGKALYEWIEAKHAPKELIPPTLMTNNPILKPFEALVKLYGIPNHDDIDPTPLIAISYPLFFGFMFGDIGQGAVLYLLSRLGELKIPSLKGIFSLIKWCSLSSILFGFLYGHIFGFGDILKPIIFSPMHDIHTAIWSSIAMGVLFLIVGYAMSLLSHYRAHGLGREFIFGKHGLAGFLFFLSLISIFFLWKKAGAISLLLPIPPALMIYIGLRDKNPIEGIFSPLISLIESFSNIVSFIRLGAFALNHSLLFMAFFTLGEMLEGSFMGSFGSLTMVILGNVVIILLEGLIVGIQALRLNLYEFFSKFYKGEGRPFKPLSPRTKETE